LGRLLSEAPSQELLNTVRSPELLSTWPLAGGEGASEALGALQQSAAKGESEEDIRADYQQLFIGPDALPAPPWESVYRSREQIVFGETTGQVRQAYARYGLQVPRLHHEPDDHISLELEFLAMLLARANRAEGQDRAALLEDHDRFLAQHLQQWAPQFFDAVCRAASTDFYRGVGMLGSDALRQVTV
jgi:TorA maturation chaperone TorD